MSDRKRIVKMAKQVREFLEVADELEAIGDLEQATRDAEQKFEEISTKTTEASQILNGVESVLARAKDELQNARDQFTQKINKAERVARSIVDEAKEKAGDIVEKAIAQELVIADRIVEDEERHAILVSSYLQAESKGRKEVEAIEEKLAEVRKQIGL